MKTIGLKMTMTECVHEQAIVTDGKRDRELEVAKEKIRGEKIRGKNKQPRS